MPRIPLVDIDQMSLEQRQQYDRFPSNLTRGLLLTDRRLAQALPELANALRSSPLDAKIREAVIVRVAALHDNAYEHLQHSEQVKAVGWSDAEVSTIKAGNLELLPEGIVAVLNFTQETVEFGQVTDVTFNRVQQFLEPADIATVILLVGHYMMVARFTAILEINLDAQPDSWAHEH